MTASRANHGRRPKPDTVRLPLGLHQCYCGVLGLPFDHQLADHPDFAGTGAPAPVPSPPETNGAKP